MTPATQGRLVRFLDMLPGITAWAVIAVTIVASFVAPVAPVLMAIIIQVYWVVRGIGMVAFGVIGFRRIARDSKIDWHARYLQDADDRAGVLDWDLIHHVVIIPNYKEPLATLRRTLRALADQKTVAGRISAVLAMEAKEDGAEVKARMLQDEFREALGGVFFTLHPSNLPGEVAGKSSNEAWAARWVHEELVVQKGFQIDTMTITSCDADSRFHPSYFSCLSYQFAVNPNRHQRIWQAPLFYHNNAWDVPAFIRFVTLSMGLNQLAQLARRWKHVFPISTYSASFKFFYGVGNWDPNVIPEDWHMYLKCFFAQKGDVVVEPIFLPINGDAPQGDNLVGTAVTRYQQALRHAWGITDFSYAVIESIRHREISIASRLAKVGTLLQEHLLWSVSWFVLFIGFGLPHIVSPHFFFTAVGILCSRFYNGVIIGASIVSPIFPLLDYFAGPPLPARSLWWKIPSAIIQWNFMPAVILVLVVIPSLHAQTRLMVGRGLNYRVTRKVATNATG
jgi:Glycosyl transferase family group 2